MGEILEHPHFTIIDNFLSEEAWTALWSSYQFMDLSPVTRTVGAWKLDDGVPLGGQEQVLERVAKPTKKKAATPGAHDAPTRALLEQVLAQTETFGELLDNDWTRVAGRPYVYPKETGLSWHVDDHELYAGAFIYYAHPIWNAHWGGELLLAEVEDDAEELPIMGYRFETEPYSEKLLNLGIGSFVMPKPNRLVVLGGAPHMVARVNPAAGHNVRATVAGFFLR